jgi:hypothetical protein
MTAMILSISDLNTSINHEPRIRDLRIAERLGMVQPLNIRQTIEANRSELERYGEVFTHSVKTAGTLGGRPATEYYLNEPQIILLCMFSRTEAAAAIRQEVIEVFMAARRKALPPPALNRRNSHEIHARTKITEGLKKLTEAKAINPDALRDFHNEQLIKWSVSVLALEEGSKILSNAAERARQILYGTAKDKPRNSLTSPLNKHSD